MHFGTQVLARHGCGSMVAGVIYYFAGHIAHFVRLAWFFKTKGGWRVFCLLFPTCDFEEALTASSPAIEICPIQLALPPWLDIGEEINYDDIEDSRYAEKTQTYREQVNDRLAKIGCLLDREQEILQEWRPLKAIAKIARDSDVPEHQHRLQLWFFAYVLHGYEFWSLKQPTHNNGHWSREEGEHQNRRFGLPHPNGSDYGWPAWKMHAKIIKAYEKRRGLGVTMQAIHLAALREDFKCKFTEIEDGHFECYHPFNEPFPSYGQFRYRVLKKYTPEEVRMARFGAATLRQKAIVEKGNVTERFADLLESAEVDAYFLSERPRPVIGDGVMPPLVVARGVCVTTAAIVGIGFSLGGENADAYRSMLFCMAVPKSLIAKIYGIPAEQLNWIAQGVPASFTSDRGPGGSKRLIANDLNAKFPIKTITVSGEGQGKAVMESSNPRQDRLDGQPTYILSDLNVIQMMKREVIRSSMDNHARDISHRLNDEALHEFHEKKWPTTPHNFWKYLADRMRTAARSMTVEQAVRAFLPEIELRVDNHGVRYRTRHFSSREFRESGTHAAIASQRDIVFKGYWVPLTFRYVWIEIHGRLFELEVVRRMATDSDDKHLSLEEVDKSDDTKKTLKAKTRLSIEAAKADAAETFEQATGKGWSDGKRVRGTPKRRSATTDREARIISGKPTARKNP